MYIILHDLSSRKCNNIFISTFVLLKMKLWKKQQGDTFGINVILKSILHKKVWSFSSKDQKHFLLLNIPICASYYTTQELNDIAISCEVLLSTRTMGIPCH
jgi:hypothetical protein